MCLGAVTMSCELNQRQDTVMVVSFHPSVKLGCSTWLFEAFFEVVGLSSPPAAEFEAH